MSENFFCVLHKNSQKPNQHFKLLIFKIILHFVTSNQISTHRKLNFSLFITRNARKTQTDQSILHVFLLSHKLLKVLVPKNLFYVVYVIGTTCFDECFFILKDIIFHKSLSLLWCFLNCDVVDFFEASVLKEVRMLCVISTITVRCW